MKKINKNNLTDENINDNIFEEIKILKEIVLNNNNLNKKENLNNIIKINKLINKIKLIKNKKENSKIIKNQIISILGPGGIGKSIFTSNLAKSINNLKILIIDFDIINNSIHTIFGKNKYSKEISQKLNKNKTIKNINIEELIFKVKDNIDLISGVDLLFNNKLEINNEKIENMLNNLKNKYDLIIIDTSAECFFYYNKCLIENSDYCIFISEGNLLEIQKSKRYLEMYINEWKINKEKINILFNKYTEDSIDYEILKEIFSEFNIIGKIKLNKKYNLIINKSPKIDLLNYKLKKEYKLIINNLFKIKKEIKRKINFFKKGNEKLWN